MSLPPLQARASGARGMYRCVRIAVLVLCFGGCTRSVASQDPLPTPGDTLVLSSDFGNGEVLVTVANGRPDSTAIRTPPGTAAVLLEIQRGTLQADDDLVRYRVRTLVGRQTEGWVYRGDTRAP